MAPLNCSWKNLTDKGRTYCFGNESKPKPFRAKELDYSAKSNEVDSLQIIPSEFTLSAGEKMNFESSLIRLVRLSAWRQLEKWIPPTAKVQSELDGNLNDWRRSILAPLDANYLQGRSRFLRTKSTVARGRIFLLYLKEDFETGYVLSNGQPTALLIPTPLPWLGARMRWIQNLRAKVAGNTLDRVLFKSDQLCGSWKAKDYIVEWMPKWMEIDVKSTVGVINQRYIFALIGNANILQVVSNYDRFQRSVPFSIEANTWYRIKTQIDIQNDSTGLIRAKAWPREETEPFSWNLEVVHDRPHKQGAPGIYALSPQSKKKVYFDNFSVYQKPR